MKSTIVITGLVAAIALANGASIYAVVVAVRKDKRTVARKGVVFGASALLLALGLGAAIDWEFFDSGKYGLAIAMPLFVSVVGIILCLWKRTPSPPSEPTGMSVTPSATQERRLP